MTNTLTKKISLLVSLVTFVLTIGEGKTHTETFTNESGAFVAGMGFGSVVRLCRSTFLERTQTQEDAEILFQKDRMYITRYSNNNDGYALPMGPVSYIDRKSILKIMDGRWEKCKEEGYNGWEDEDVVKYRD